MTLHVVRRIQFVDALGVLGLKGPHLDVRVRSLVRLLAFFLIEARADIAHHCLDGAGTFVQPRQLLGDIVVNEINVQRSRPVYQNVLLSEKAKQLQPVVRAENTDALVYQTVRLKA